MKKYPNFCNQFTCLSVVSAESLAYGSHNMGSTNESYKELLKNVFRNYLYLIIIKGGHSHPRDSRLRKLCQSWINWELDENILCSNNASNNPCLH